MKQVAQSVGLMPRGGMGLVEVVVALLLLAGGMLAVTSTGTVVISQLKISQTELELWAALQTVGDSLQQLGHGNAAAGTRVDGGYTFTWTVDTSATDSLLAANLNRITLAGSVTEPALRSDTVLIYLADY